MSANEVHATPCLGGQATKLRCLKAAHWCHSAWSVESASNMWDEDGSDSYTTGEGAPTDERVLVAVVPRPSDWELVCAQRWYRIPVSRAPRRLAADYIAFYHTGSFRELRWSIRYYAPIERYRLMRRMDLFPDQPNHPRAQELYYRIELGPLESLPRPIPSLKLRRVTFIMTTLSRLLSAQEINDLWLRTTARDRLWLALKTREVMARREYAIREGDLRYEADIAVLCMRRNLAIECIEEPQPRPKVEHVSQEQLLVGRGWTIQRFAVDDIMADVESCVEIVRAFVRSHGGQPGMIIP